MRLRRFLLNRGPLETSLALEDSVGRVATIGNFDGVHRGHQEVIRALVSRARAKGLRSTVLSFFPHPRVVLNRCAGLAPINLARLSPLRQKLRLLSALGVDELVLLHFTENVRTLSAAEFVERVLVSQLNVEHMVLGYDSRIGKGREGNPDRVLELLARHNRSGEVLQPLNDVGEAISSRRVRSALESGDVSAAARLLGRPYSLLGRVAHGDGRGKTIGFATANLHTLNQVLPAIGVYAGVGSVGTQRLNAVANIGYRPTFHAAGGSKITVEVHFLDQSGAEHDTPTLDLYGKFIEFELVARIRDERKFEDVSQLVNQIKSDCDYARSILPKVSVAKGEGYE